jgi:hypothetical protein
VLYALFSWRGLSLLNDASKREEYEAITNHQNDEEDSKDTPIQDDNREDSSDESSSSSLLATIVLWRTYLLSLVLLTALINLVIEVQKASKEVESIKEQEEDEFYYFVRNYGSLISTIGSMSIWSNGVLSTSVLIIGTGLSFYYRSNVKRSSTIVRWCITMVLIVKLWPSVVQMDAKFGFAKVFTYYAGEDFQAEKESFIATIRLLFAIESAMDIVPLIIAFPRGMLAAAMSIFALIPTAATPKILVMFFSPFATLLLILGASSITQLVGEPFLAISLSCLFLKDVLVYFSFDDLLEGRIEAFISSKIAKARQCAGIIGIVFLIVWFSKHLGPCFGGNIKEFQCEVFSTEILMGMAVRFFMVLSFSKLVMADLLFICLARAEPLLLNESDISFFIIDSAGNGEDSKNDSNAKNDDVEAGSNTKRDVLNNDPMTVFPVALSANTNDNAGNSEDNKNDSNAKDDVEEATNSTTKDAENNIYNQDEETDEEEAANTFPTILE